MATNLPAYNIFRYFCTTEQQYVFERRVGTAPPPTVCKNDGGSITNLSIYKKISKLNGPLLKINGTTISEVSPNYIDFDSQYYNVSDTGSGVSKVYLKVDDSSTAADVLWSADKINSLINNSSAYTVKVSENDTTPNYLSSSLISSNSITYSILNPGAEEKYQAAIADPLTINNLVLNSSLSVNYINGINGTDVNITSYLQYKNRGIILNNVIRASYASNVDARAKFYNSSIYGGSIVNNNMFFNGTDSVIIRQPGFYNILAMVSYTDTSNAGTREIHIKKNSRTIAQASARGTNTSQAVSLTACILDYAAASDTYGLNISPIGASMLILSSDSGGAAPTFLCINYEGY